MPISSKREFKSAMSVLVGITILAVTIYLVRIWEFRTAEKALQYFVTNAELAEDQLRDPLILCPQNKQIESLVIRAISDKSMPKRRYAISFLGNQGTREAMPELENILLDKTEKDYFRGDALEAIFQINAAKGRELAQTYQNTDDYLGKIARYIVEEEPWISERRTYLDAFIGRHD
jgi:hypothetical protein